MLRAVHLTNYVCMTAPRCQGAIEVVVHFIAIYILDVRAVCTLDNKPST